MDRHDLLERVQAARARAGIVTAATLKQQTHDDLLEELRNEQAGTLGRLGRRLDLALATLGDLEEGAASAVGESRAALVRRHEQVRDDLLDALWEMTVVREAMGLRGVRRELDQTWPVPPPLT